MERKEKRACAIRLGICTSLLISAVVAEHYVGENDGVVAVFAQVGRHAAGMGAVGEVREVLSIPEIPQTTAEATENTDKAPQVILLYETT